jgi:protein-S-isoprenylcysteine O-methyltransferase Ste14
VSGSLGLTLAHPSGKTGRSMRMSTLLRDPLDVGAIPGGRKTVFLIAVLLVGAVFVVGASRWPEGHLVHESFERLGVGLIFICIFGRTWCSLYIGGRKNSELVTTGPYSVCRNPLYAFSILGAAGVGAQLGSITITAAAGMIAWVVFLMVVIQEEKHLISVHGDAYRDYLKRVPRFLPRLSRWRNVDVIEVLLPRVTMTFVDSCVFLLAMPIAEAFEYLQDSGVIPVLFRLP